MAWTRRGEWHDIRSSDLNTYLKAGVGDEFSAKDFRTWSATVLAAVQLAILPSAFASERQRRQDIAAAVSQVADVLGNTPTVCRTSYIDPRVIDRFAAGQTIAVSAGAMSQSAAKTQMRHERAVIALLSGKASATGKRHRRTGVAA